MLSERQKQILAFPYTDYDALICDGAIRSGKTSLMTIGFVDDAMRRFNGQLFGIAGKTVDSAIKNIVVPYRMTDYAKRRYRMRWNSKEKMLTVSDGKTENRFEVFGGKDESSFTLVQGRTFAGALIDEAVLQPKSFVEQVCARCSVDGSKIWFSCNPGSPDHWFYKEWVLQADRLNALRLHFLLRDNPALSDRIIERYERMYDGVFYQRYILGEWVVAEGLVFRFDRERNACGSEERSGTWYLSCDYGITNPMVVQLWCVAGGVAYCETEYYFDSRMENKRRTDEEHYTELERIAAGKNIEFIVVDPSASSFIETISRHGKYAVRRADNDVIGGISNMATLMNAGRMRWNPERCPDTIREFGLYSWDTDSGADEPIKENDHGCDASRYFAQTVLVNEFDWINWSVPV